MSKLDYEVRKRLVEKELDDLWKFADFNDVNSGFFRDSYERYLGFDSQIASGGVEGKRSAKAMTSDVDSFVEQPGRFKLVFRDFARHKYKSPCDVQSQIDNLDYVGHDSTRDFIVRTAEVNNRFVGEVAGAALREGLDVALRNDSLLRVSRGVFPERSFYENQEASIIFSYDMFYKIVETSLKNKEIRNELVKLGAASARRKIEIMRPFLMQCALGRADRIYG
jgi:hypothetical protein